MTTIDTHTLDSNHNRILLKPILVYETQKTQIFTTIPSSLTSPSECLYYTLPHPHYYPCMH